MTNSSTSSTGNSQKGFGGRCLMLILKLIGILLLIGIVPIWGWIVGVIWLLFFRKKLSDNPKKQKISTIIVSVSSAEEILSTEVEPISTAEEIETQPVPTQAQQPVAETYFLNTSTHKIHHSSCRDVKKIKPENYSTSNATVDELTAQGYSTCGHCF